jgi:outer membrane immunogenic protein
MKRIAFAGTLVAAMAAGLPALAADMPVKAVRPMVAIDNWSGPYVGVNVGYSWGHARTGFSLTDQQVGTITQTTLGGTVLNVTTIAGPVNAFAASDRAKMDGFLGGGQVGYNWRRDNWLFGVEADMQATGEKGSSLFCVTAGCPVGSTTARADFHLRWFGTLRGRAGLLWDNLLIYATGGLAAGQLNSDYVLGTVGGATPIALGSASNIRFGYAVGAGGEYRFSERWSVKLEYLYMDLGGNGASLTGSVTSLPLIVTVGDFRFVGVATTTSRAAFNTRFTDNILRAGLNYRF